MNQPQYHQVATYLIDNALSELVRYVIEDTSCTIEQAMERVYNSSLMPALQDEEGELYVQSPAYLYELMNRIEEKTLTINTFNDVDNDNDDVDQRT
ncbi:MAG: hypothetical protein J5661_01145 [Bacteroidaceae bacterium]|nr:hypothetical protein [Bacteroidaceae bacterium]